MRKKVVAIISCMGLSVGVLVGNSVETKCAEKKELTMLVSTDDLNAGLEAVGDLAEKEIGIKINFETRPSGTEGNNVVKTRLASGDMPDLCLYNSGALLGQLDPEEFFINLTQEDFTQKITDGYKDVVSVDGKIYGIPAGSSQAGGIVYSKTLYEKYGLVIPKTWEEFLDNCNVLKDAGEIAVLATYADVWTAAVPFLADAYNLQTNDESFIKEFEKGNAKWATSPEALRSFEKMADLTQYYNDDYLSTTYNDGCDIMANAGAGHWFILSSALANIYDLYGDEANDLGIFPVPSDSEDVNGMTMWYPNAIYGNANSNNQAEILDFMEFYLSDEALTAYSEAYMASGPYCVKEYEDKENSLQAATEDIQLYMDLENVLPANEYICRVQGEEISTICQELSTGQTTAEEAAEKYDKNCEKQATQLGLKWN